MLKRSQFVRWAIFASLTLSLFIVRLTSHPSAQTPANGNSDTQVAFPPKHGIEGAWSAEERAREMDRWHELNRRRLARTHRLGAEAVGAEASVVDVDDISIIQDDGTLLTQNLFDLNARTVQFTPSGSAYVITNAVAAFDANLGTKLNLTASPAVNAATAAQPGDDAYILQDLGFNFSFYGSSYAQVAVGSNGYLTFRPSGVSDAFFNTNSTDSGESLTDLQTTLPRIAPYWHDLDARAIATMGDTGIYFRQAGDRLVVTWNNIRDYPNVASRDTGVHRFQIVLFNDGRIHLTYEGTQLTTTALAGISPGNSSNMPTIIDLRNPPSEAISAPIAESFAVTPTVDLNGIVRAFYLAHPNQDVYDFVDFVTDFNFDLGGGAFAFYRGLSNDATGIGQNPFDSSTKQTIGSQRIQGILNLNNLVTAYPALPSERLLNAGGGADSTLSIWAQEQGHRWLARALYSGADPNLLLGRSNSHWNYFLNIESTISGPAARRSSSMEGSLWRENGDGTFISVNLVDGYSRLDHYLMGLRPLVAVPDMFVITSPTGTTRTRSSPPRPNITIGGTKQIVTINDVIQANGPRIPNDAASQKNFRAAFILFIRRGEQASPQTLAKLKLFRLAWESYFRQATDNLANINTGLAEQNFSRTIAAVSAASYAQTLAPGEIAALFGANLADNIALATTQPLPDSLAGVKVLVNGTAAGLFFVSPTQINFQMPRTTPSTINNILTQFIPSAAATIEVWRDGQLIRAGVFQVAPAVPAVFTLDQSGAGPATALDAFTFTGPPFNARRAGGEPNIIAVFATGLGADATDVDDDVSANMQVEIDGNPAAALYAGRAPGFIGLNQLNVLLPIGIAPGTHTLIVSRNGVPSNPTTIAIR